MNTPTHIEPAAPPALGLAVVLAAGAGSRMGHRPKGLLHINGQALIQRTLAHLRGAGIQDVVVVLGEELLLAVQRFGSVRGPGDVPRRAGR